MHDEVTPPAAALLRRPDVRVRHRVMADLRESGFTDILPAHLGVFQHPGPEGVRPGVLAARAQASKQAMNHLLHQLEETGYLVRVDSDEDRRMRVVRLTDRGRAAARTIDETVHKIEAEWANLLGETAYAGLRAGLARLEALLEDCVERP